MTSSHSQKTYILLSKIKNLKLRPISRRKLTRRILFKKSFCEKRCHHVVTREMRFPSNYLRFGCFLHFKSTVVKAPHQEVDVTPQLYEIAIQSLQQNYDHVLIIYFKKYFVVFLNKRRKNCHADQSRSSCSYSLFSGRVVPFGVRVYNVNSIRHS